MCAGADGTRGNDPDALLDKPRGLSNVRFDMRPSLLLLALLAGLAAAQEHPAPPADPPKEEKPKEEKKVEAKAEKVEEAPAEEAVEETTEAPAEEAPAEAAAEEKSE